MSGGATAIFDPRDGKVVVIESPDLHMGKCQTRRYRCLDDAEHAQLVGRPPKPDESIIVQCDCGTYVQ